ncbi:MAG: AraC family transcriptional regulator [Marinicella sp.]|nr:helix-turn-helix transcriptional regulator [Xanthomonadales bacterium]
MISDKCINVNRYVEESICKTTIKKNIGKDILLVISHLDSPVTNKVASTLSKEGFKVTVAGNDETLNVGLFDRNKLIYVDCCYGLTLLDKVIRVKKENRIIVAITSDSSCIKEQLFAKEVYDYISTSISHVELLHKTNLYLLYAAACSLKIFEEQERYNQRSENKEKVLVRSACHYLLNNMPSYSSLDDLCRFLGTNRNTLAIAFKNQLGMSAYTWFRNARIIKARNLLEWSDIDIQSICFEVGYENAANFSTSFKALTGLSPRQYRKLHNKNFK